MPIKSPKSLAQPIASNKNLLNAAVKQSNVIIAQQQHLYNQNAINCSVVTTKAYSTSFSLGIKALSKPLREPIYAIYGFVRFADEIVDTFFKQDRAKLLQEFKESTYTAIERGLSINPILHAFQQNVRQYHIELSLIEAFFNSMEMDLEDNNYNTSLYQRYIYGSAEVVGLMCLRVFCKDNPAAYEKLKPTACHLGAAFQKVNFLRDLRADYENRGRVYFPDLNIHQFNQAQKAAIEQEIQKDFNEARKGIKQLPKGARFGVYTAYRYYLRLFQLIQNSSPEQVYNQRIRVPNIEKLSLLARSAIKNRLNMI